MIKMILSFLIVFGLTFGAIELFRKLSKKEKWELTTTLGYSIIIAVVAVLLLTLLVILF